MRADRRGPDPGEAGTLEVHGVPLYLRRWRPPAPRAGLAVVHGFGEHGGRFSELAALLVDRGIEVQAVDLPGHGRSPGQRGYVESFAQMIDAAGALHAEVARGLPVHAPAFLLGHSMGGLAVLRWLELHPGVPPAGAIVSAPALRLALPIPDWLKALARGLSRAAPRLVLPSMIGPADLSHDPEEIAAVRRDPLVHRRITPRLFAEMERAMGLALAERERVAAPLLLLVPGDDPVADASVTLDFARGTSFDVRRYPGFRHEPLHETGRAAVMADIADWIEARIG